MTTDAGVPDWACDARETVELRVDLASASESVLRHGYLHGIRDPHRAAPDDARRALLYETALGLGARTWRLSDPWHLAFFEPFEIELTYVLITGFGGFDPYVRPWEPDLMAWERYVRGAVQANLDRGSPVDWIEIWGEPLEIAEFPRETRDTFRAAHDAIRAIDPTARIVAPCTLGFTPRILEAFLDDALATGRRYDALCWHSFGEPAEVITEASTARAMLDARPGLGAMEIHVNEYMPGEQAGLPGYNVAWLAALEAARIHVANRACWEMPAPGGAYINCWAGIDGVLMPDGVTPQPVFHVLEPYGHLGATRLAVTGTTAALTAIAGRDADTSELRVLIGNAGMPSRDGASVVLRFAGATTSATVDVDRIPSLTPTLEARALPSPMRAATVTVSPSDGAATVDLGCVPRGAAVVVRSSL
jgi:hypothetical protein